MFPVHAIWPFRFLASTTLTHNCLCSGAKIIDIRFQAFVEAGQFFVDLFTLLCSHYLFWFILNSWSHFDGSGLDDNYDGDPCEVCLPKANDCYSILNSDSWNNYFEKFVQLLEHSQKLWRKLCFNSRVSSVYYPWKLFDGFNFWFIRLLFLQYDKVMGCKPHCWSPAIALTMWLGLQLASYGGVSIVIRLS